MNLLVCATEYYPHGFGIANVAHRVVERLKVKGVSCTVCSPTGPDITTGSRRLIRELAVGGLLHYWTGVARLPGADEYDAIWMHNPLFPGMSPFPHGVATIHSTYLNKYCQGMSPQRYYRLASAIERRSLARTARVNRFTAVSETVDADLRAIGLDPSRIALIPNGVDTGCFSPGEGREELRRDLDIPGGHTVLIFLGRMSEVKQPERLVETFSHLHRLQPDTTLVMAGGGDRLDATRACARDLGIDEAVRFLGTVDSDETPELYRVADCFVMASRSEGSPLALLEAFSTGLPAIVSPIQPLCFVEDQGIGRVVDFDQPEAAAESMARYIDSDLRRAGERARTYVTERHDWSVIADQYIAEFERAAEYR
ncbi:MAG: glycosyltransferase family 4 protein [Methanospirillum sp.]